MATQHQSDGFAPVRRQFVRNTMSIDGEESIVWNYQPAVTRRGACAERRTSGCPCHISHWMGRLKTTPYAVLVTLGDGSLFRFGPIFHPIIPSHRAHPGGTPVTPRLERVEPRSLEDLRQLQRPTEAERRAVRRCSAVPREGRSRTERNGSVTCEETTYTDTPCMPDMPISWGG